MHITISALKTLIIEASSRSKTSKISKQQTLDALSSSKSKPEAAKKLGISMATLYSLLKMHDIPVKKLRSISKEELVAALTNADSREEQGRLLNVSPTRIAALIRLHSLQDKFPIRVDQTNKSDFIAVLSRYPNSNQRQIQAKKLDIDAGTIPKLIRKWNLEDRFPVATEHNQPLYEKNDVLIALALSHNNIQATADMLGIGMTAMRDYIRRWKLQDIAPIRNHRTSKEVFNALATTQSVEELMQKLNISKDYARLLVNMHKNKKQ